MKKLAVSCEGMFYILQGEGKTTGCPAVFVRLQACNLSCVWCDTKHTWNSDTKGFRQFKWMTVDEVATALKEAWNNGCKNRALTPRLVITGGEPLLQRHAIESLIKSLPDWNVEIETNGTTIPTDYLLQRCQFNCSPKLSHSGNERDKRLVPEAIKTIATTDHQFKFVVASETDLAEIERDFVEPFNLKPENIIVMPEGTTVEANREHTMQVVEAVKTRGYRLMPRFHIELWGNVQRV